MPGSHWRHHYPLFSIPTGHMNSHICTYTGVLCVSTDCKVPQRVFFFPVSSFLPPAVFWALAGTHAHFGCLHLLNSHGRLNQGLLQNQPEPFVAKKKKKRKKKKKSWYVMKWEKQQRRKAGWLNRKEAFLTDLRNETAKEALMLTNPFVSGLLIHAWALKKKKKEEKKKRTLT